MTHLVTGAGGFVGLALLDRLLTEGESVRALNDRPLAPEALAYFETLPGRLEVIQGDVRDRAAVAAALKGAAGAVHLAAITLGARADIVPARRAAEVNTLSTAILLEEARRAGVPRVVYPSSGAVYGALPLGPAPVTEATEPAPAGIYGFTKLASETLAAEANRDGLTTVRARITAVFGPWEYETGVRETLSPPFQLAARGLRGLATRISPGGARDWTSSRDIARALATLLRAETLPHDLYNLSSGAIWRPDLLAQAMQAGAPFAWSLTGAATDEGDLAYNDDLSATRTPIDGRRFREDFGFDYLTPAEAAADYAAWLATPAASALLTPKGDAA
ncbi:MAG: NAD(P)-dependent oxidoreductase [Pseudomonadota bacterium]|nr:NAD(P)-dependent oxidoreductase [Pseudomonadota bacterium]